MLHEKQPLGFNLAAFLFENTAYEDEKKPQGLYGAFDVSSATQKHLAQWAKAAGIEDHLLDLNEAHVTTIYCRKPLDVKPVEIPLTAKFLRFEVFGDTEGTLVAVIDQPFLHNLFFDRLQAGAEWDFPTYVPHVSIAKDITKEEAKKLPPIDFPIELTKEVFKPLNEDYDQSKNKKEVKAAWKDQDFKDFDDAYAYQQVLEKDINVASAKIQKYPKSHMGLPPENVRLSKEYQIDKRRLAAAMDKLRDFNVWFVKKYKKQLIAKRDSNRIAKQTKAFLVAAGIPDPRTIETMTLNKAKAWWRWHVPQPELPPAVKDLPSHIELCSIRTPIKHRRRGQASALLDLILRTADESNVPVRALVSPLDRKTNLKELQEFYKSNGFKDTGEKANLAGDTWFERPAKDIEKYKAKNTKSKVQAKIENVKIQRVEVKVFKNGTKQEIQNFIKNNQGSTDYSEMRGLYSNGDVYLWSAYKAIHWDMWKALALPEAAYNISVVRTSPKTERLSFYGSSPNWTTKIGDDYYNVSFELNMDEKNQTEPEKCKTQLQRLFPPTEFDSEVKAAIEVAALPGRIGSAITLSNIPAKYKNLPVLSRGTTSIILDEGDGNVIVLTRDSFKAEWLYSHAVNGLEIATLLEQFQAHHALPAIRLKDVYVLRMPKLSPLSLENKRKVKAAIQEFNKMVQKYHGYSESNSKEADRRELFNEYLKNEDDPRLVAPLMRFLSNYDTNYDFDLRMSNFMQDREGNIILIDPVADNEIVEAFRKKAKMNYINKIQRFKYNPSFALNPDNHYRSKLDAVLAGTSIPYIQPFQLIAAFSNNIVAKRKKRIEAAVVQTIEPMRFASPYNKPTNKNQSNLINFAKRELQVLRGKNPEPDEMQDAIERSVLDMIEKFSEGGHSGGSAGYTIGLLTRLLQFKPICPLTGENDEWMDVHSIGDGKILYQNKRCSTVFKDYDGSTYNMDGKVFREPDGIGYTNTDSRVPVTFPYTPPEHPEYVDVPWPDPDPTDERLNAELKQRIAKYESSKNKVTSKTAETNNSILLFHGTTIENGKRIIAHGFVPKGGPSKAYGKAVYFMDHPYGTRLFNKNKNSVILVYRTSASARIAELPAYGWKGKTKNVDIIRREPLWTGENFSSGKPILNVEYAVLNMNCIKFVGFFDKEKNKIVSKLPVYSKGFDHKISTPKENKETTAKFEEITFYEGSSYTKILIDGTINEVRNFLLKSKVKSIKAIYCTDSRNFYVWDAYSLLHEEVESYYGLENCYDFNIEELTERNESLLDPKKSGKAWKSTIKGTTFIARIYDNPSSKVVEIFQKYFPEDLENKETTAKVREEVLLGNGKTIDVLINPSKNIINGFIKNCTSGIRGFYCLDYLEENRILYVWSAFEATHENVENALDLSHTDDFYITDKPGEKEEYSINNNSWVTKINGKDYYLFINHNSHALIDLMIKLFPPNEQQPLKTTAKFEEVETKTGTVDVLVNGTKIQIARLLRTNSNGHARILYDRENDTTYIWDAYTSTHRYLEDAIDYNKNFGNALIAPIEDEELFIIENGEVWKTRIAQDVYFVVVYKNALFIETMKKLKIMFPPIPDETTAKFEETKKEWLSRHNVPKESNKYVLYHATPKRGGAKDTLRKNSYLEEDPDSALFFAGRDRNLKPSGLNLHRLLLDEDDINPGIFMKLSRDFPIGKHTLVQPNTIKTETKAKFEEVETRTGTVDVLVDASKNEIIGLLKKSERTSKDPGIRMLYDKKTDYIYAWDAWEGTHDDLDRAIDTNRNTAFGNVFMYPYVDEDLSGLERVYITLFNKNKYVVAVYKNTLFIETMKKMKIMFPPIPEETTASHIPKFLYHATYQPYLSKIKKEGLHGNNPKKNYEDSKAGIVYLAKKPSIAESYAETSEEVPESYLDKIIVLKIVTEKLDLKLLKNDTNVIDGTDTFEYHGIIPPKAIQNLIGKQTTAKFEEIQLYLPNETIDKTINLCINPSKQEAQGFLKRFEHGLRGILDFSDVTLYLWDAYNAIHHEVAAALGLKHKNINIFEVSPLKGPSQYNDNEDFWSFKIDDNYYCVTIETENSTRQKQMSNKLRVLFPPDKSLSVEAKFEDIDLERGETLKALVNPSKAEFYALLDKCPDGVRGIYDFRTETMYTWDALDSEHGSVQLALGLSSNGNGNFVVALTSANFYSSTEPVWHFKHKEQWYDVWIFNRYKSTVLDVLEKLCPPAKEMIESSVKTPLQIKGMPDGTVVYHKGIQTALNRGGLTPKVTYGYRGHMFDISLHPTDIEGWKKYRKGTHTADMQEDKNTKYAYYDPNHAILKTDKFGDNNEYHSILALPKEHVNTEIKPLPEHNTIYRGMSYEEFQNLINTGEVKSLGSYNLGDKQKGLTYWSTNPNQAVSYAHSFAPSAFKAIPGKPAYVVAAIRPKPENIIHVEGTGEDEVGVNIPIKEADIRAVWSGTPVTYEPMQQMFVGVPPDNHEYNVSGGVSASATLNWQRIAKLKTEAKVREEITLKNGDIVTVLTNPPKQSLYPFIRKCAEGTRGCYDIDNKSFYVWDGYDATHEDVCKSLKLLNADDFFISAQPGIISDYTDKDYSWIFDCKGKDYYLWINHKTLTLITLLVKLFPPNEQQPLKSKVVASSQVETKAKVREEVELVDGRTITVLSNPSKNTLHNFLKNCVEGMRGCYENDKTYKQHNLYAWAAYDATHVDVFYALNLDDETYDFYITDKPGIITEYSAGNSWVTNVKGKDYYLWLNHKTLTLITLLVKLFPPNEQQPLKSKVVASSQVERLNQVPKYKIGQAPIPAGMERRFHYTSEKYVPSIKQHGLLVKNSQGHKFGDPNGIWSEGEKYLKDYKAMDRPVVEFYSDPKDWNGLPYSFKDVPPEHIIAIHEPWHDTYHAVKDDKTSMKLLEKVKEGRGNEKYAKAYDVLKAEGYEGKAEASCITFDKLREAYKNAYGDRDPKEVMQEIYKEQDKKFPELAGIETTARGAGASRLAQHIQNGTPFFTISAMRGEFGSNENKRRTNDLVKALHTLPVSFVPVQGKFEETKADGTKHIATEHSFFVMPLKGKEHTKTDAFLKIGTSLCNTFEQEAIGFGDGKNIYFVNQQGEKDKVGNAVTFDESKIQHLPGFSMIGSHKFSFDSHTPIADMPQAVNYNARHEWWDKLTKDEQEYYIKEHPGTMLQEKASI